MPLFRIAPTIPHYRFPEIQLIEDREGTGEPQVLIIFHGKQGRTVMELYFYSSTLYKL